jgi:hypothetical protein
VFLISCTSRHARPTPPTHAHLASSDVAAFREWRGCCSRRYTSIDGQVTGPSPGPRLLVIRTRAALSTRHSAPQRCFVASQMRRIWRGESKLSGDRTASRPCLVPTDPAPGDQAIRRSGDRHQNRPNPATSLSRLPSAASIRSLPTGDPAEAGLLCSPALRRSTQSVASCVVPPAPPPTLPHASRALLLPTARRPTKLSSRVHAPSPLS